MTRPHIKLLVLMLCAPLIGFAQPTSWEMTMGAGKAAMQRGDYVAAEQQYRLAVNEAQVYGAESANLAESLRELACTLHLQGKNAEAEPLFVRALAIREKLLGSENKVTADTRVWLAQCLLQQGKTADAEPLYWQGMTDLEKALGSGHPQVLSNYGLMARNFNNAGEFVRAVPAYRKWLECTEKANDPWGEIVEITCALATVFHLLGKDAEAEPLLLQAVTAEQKRREPGSKQMTQVHPYLRLAGCRAVQGKYAEAESPLRECLAEGAMGKGNYNLPEVLTAQGLLCFIQGCLLLDKRAATLRAGLSVEVAQAPLALDYSTMNLGPRDPLADYRAQALFAEAEPLLKRAVDMRESAKRSDNAWWKAVQEKALAESLNNLAAVYIAQGKFALAESLLQRARALLDACAKMLVPPTGGSHPGLPQVDLAPVLINQAACLLNRPNSYEGNEHYKEIWRRAEQAEPLVQRALALREARFGKDSLPVAQMLCQLSACATWRGAYFAIEPLARAQSIAEGRLEPDDPDYLSITDHLTWVYRDCAEKRAEEEKTFARLLERSEDKFGKDSESIIPALTRMAWYYRVFGPPERAEGLFDRIRAIVQAKHGAESAEMAGALENEAWNTYHHENPSPYREALQRVLAMREKVFGAESLPAADAQLGIQFSTREPDRNAAETAIRRVLALYEKLGGTNSPEVMAALDLLEDRCSYGKAPDQRAELLRRRLSVAEAVFGKEHPRLLPILSRLGGYYDFVDKPEEATPYYRRALAIQEQALGVEDPGLARPLMTLQENCYLIAGDGEREQLLLRALAITEKAYGVKDRQVDYILSALMEAYGMQNRHAEREMLVRRRIAIWKSEGDGARMVADLLPALGGALVAQGKHAEAEKAFAQSLAAVEKEHGPRHEQVCWPLGALARCYEAQGKYAQAQPLRERAYDIYQHNNVNNVINDLGENYLKQGKFALAEALYRERLAAAEREYPGKPLYLVDWLLCLGELAADQRRFDEARALFMRARSCAEQGTKPDDPWLSRFDTWIAACDAAQGKADDAEAHYRRAVQLAETLENAARHPFLAECLEQYASFLRARKRDEEADELAARAASIRKNAEAYETEMRKTAKRFREGSRMF